MVERKGQMFVCFMIFFGNSSHLFCRRDIYRQTLATYPSGCGLVISTAAGRKNEPDAEGPQGSFSSGIALTFRAYVTLSLSSHADWYICSLQG